MPLPTWHPKTDDELREIIRGVWEGRILGTWQFEDRWRDQKRLFPDFFSLQAMKFDELAGRAVFSSSPEAAHDFARLPIPMEGYRDRPDTVPAPDATQTEAPPTAPWEVLDPEEWNRLRALLGYPAPKDR